MDNRQKENVELLVGILMGVSVSVVLSIVGPIISGHPSLVSIVVAMLCSTVISVLIGIFVPIKKITDGACNAMKIDPAKILGRIVSTFISDLCFTPIISFAMVYMNYKRNMRNDPSMVFGRMYFGNLLISFTIAFILIFFLTPVFVKLGIKKFVK